MLVGLLALAGAASFHAASFRAPGYGCSGARRSRTLVHATEKDEAVVAPPAVLPIGGVDDMAEQLEGHSDNINVRRRGWLEPLQPSAAPGRHCEICSVETPSSEHHAFRRNDSPAVRRSSSSSPRTAAAASRCGRSLMRSRRRTRRRASASSRSTLPTLARSSAQRRSVPPPRHSLFLSKAAAAPLFLSLQSRQSRRSLSLALCLPLCSARPPFHSLSHCRERRAERTRVLTAF